MLAIERVDPARPAFQAVHQVEGGGAGAAGPAVAGGRAERVQHRAEEGGELPHRPGVQEELGEGGIDPTLFRPNQEGDRVLGHCRQPRPAGGVPLPLPEEPDHAGLRAGGDGGGAGLIGADRGEEAVDPADVPQGLGRRLRPR